MTAFPNPGIPDDLMMELNLLISRVVWDVIPPEHAPAVLEKMGLTPPSEEGKELAIKESKARKEQLAPVLPRLELLSGFTAGALYQYYSLVGTLDGFDDEEKRVFSSLITTIIAHSSKALLANLISPQPPVKFE